MARILNDLRLTKRNVPKAPIIIGDRQIVNSPFRILSYGPYELAIKNQILVVKLEDQIPKNFNEKDKIENFFNSNTWPQSRPFPFNQRISRFEEFFKNSKLEVLYSECKSDELTDFISHHSPYTMIILHDQSLNDTIYSNAKIQAIISGTRVQFIDFKHISKIEPYTIFNIWIQLMSKCEGTPWLLSNNADFPFVNDESLIASISFSTKYENVSYGVAHFLDTYNMKQEIIIEPDERKNANRALELSENELTKIIKRAIKWFKENKNGRKKLNLFLYKTTPLRPIEKKVIDSFISNPDDGLEEVSITHIHIKSANFGIPRLYDMENVGYAGFNYMPLQGQCIKLEPNEAEIEGFEFRGEIIISTTGLIEGLNPRGPKGTPVPLLLSIFSNKKGILDTIENQAMAMTGMDWEYTGKNYRAPFLTKYSYRLARLISYQKKELPAKMLSKVLDIRDLM